MNYFGSKYCPQCKTEIPEDRILDSNIICPSCAWSFDKNQVDFHNKTQKKIIKFFVLTSIFMIVIYFYTLKWDQYSFQVLSIKIQQLIGGAQISSQAQMAKICDQRKLFSCSVERLNSIVKSNPQNLDALSTLATTLHRTKREDEAIVAYSKYFEQNGREVNLAYNFAKLLEKKGNYNKALEYYEFILNQSPETFETSVNHNYAQLLIKTGDYQKAKLFIKKVQKQGINSPNFMLIELKEISKLAKR